MPSATFDDHDGVNYFGVRVHERIEFAYTERSVNGVLLASRNLAPVDDEPNRLLRTSQDEGQLPQMNKICIDDIELGIRIGSGSHSHAHHVENLPGDVVAIVLRDYDAMHEPAVSCHFANQVAYMKRIRDEGIVFRDRLVAPEVFDFIVNDIGLNIGYLMEYIPGEDLRDFAARKDIDKSVLGGAIELARTHLRAIHSSGYVHGDPNPGNIRIQVVNGGLVTHWFDYEVGRSPQQPDHWYSTEKDFEIFERHVLAVTSPSYKDTYVRPS